MDAAHVDDAHDDSDSDSAEDDKIRVERVLARRDRDGETQYHCCLVSADDRWNEWIDVDGMEACSGGLRAIQAWLDGRRHQQKARPAKAVAVESAAEVPAVSTAALPAPAASGRRDVCLLFAGSFNPVHNGHLQLMDEAARYMEQEHHGGGVCKVVRGVFMPTSTAGAIKKLGLEALSGTHRAAMLRAALRGSRWEVNDWLALHDGNPGVRAATSRVREAVEREQGAGKVEFVTVCGCDTVSRLRKAAAQSLVVCVVNRDVDFDVDAFAATERSAGSQLVVTRCAVANHSSSLVRRLIGGGIADVKRRQQLLQCVPAAVLEYHEQHGIDYAPKTLAQSTASVPEDANVQNALREVAASKLRADWADYDVLQSVCGSGVTARVLSARERSTGAIVAVKMLSLAGEANTKRMDKKVARAVVRELDTMRRMSFVAGHTNCCVGTAVCVLDKGARIGIIMPLCEGTLWALVEGRPLGSSRTSSLLCDVARGMVCLHSAAIVHRDLHSRNILVDRGGTRAWVADFGHSLPLKRLSREDKRGSLMHYAPEALSDGASYGPASDVYSWALLAVVALTGAEVWPGMRVNEAMANTLAGARPPLPPCSDELAATVKSAWAHKAAERPTFEAIVRKLHV